MSTRGLWEILAQLSRQLSPDGGNLEQRIRASDGMKYEDLKIDVEALEMTLDELEQQVETAKGNAESTIVNAKATAESIRIRAQALEQNAKLVEWEAVQKWDGKLPVYQMGGAMPFIQLPSAK